MIQIFSGNLGSGKTACAVRDLVNNINNRKTYTNIIAKKPIHNHVLLKKDMIIKKEIVGYKKSRDSKEQTPIYKFKVNKEHWQSIGEPINVIIDEAHTIFSARRSMSTKNLIISDWLAMLRRILGQDDVGYGKLTFITQMPYKLDVHARDMCTHFRHHRSHFLRTCKLCAYIWRGHSDMAEENYICPKCRIGFGRIHSPMIEVWHYRSMEHFENNCYHKHYLVRDIEKYFPYYDTLQWDNLFDD